MSSCSPRLMKIGATALCLLLAGSGASAVGDPRLPGAPSAMILDDAASFPREAERTGAVESPGPGSGAGMNPPQPILESESIEDPPPASSPDEADPKAAASRPLPFPPAGRGARPEGRRAPITLTNQGWLRALSGFGVVLVALLALRRLIRRTGGPLMGGRGPAGVIEVLGRYPFAKGQSLVLLKLDRRVLLLCQTSAGASTLTEFDDPEDVASILQRVQDEEGVSFNRRLEDILHGSEARSRRARRDERRLNISALGSAEVIDLTAQASRDRRRNNGPSQLEVGA